MAKACLGIFHNWEECGEPYQDSNDGKWYQDYICTKCLVTKRKRLYRL